MLRPNQTLISFLLQKTSSPKVIFGNDPSKKIHQLCDYCVSRMRMNRDEGMIKRPMNEAYSPHLENTPSSAQEPRTDSKEARYIRQDDIWEESTQDQPAATSPVLGIVSRNGRRTILSASESKWTKRCTCRRDVDRISSFQKLGISSFDNTASGNKSTHGPINVLKSTSVSKLNPQSKKKVNESDKKKERDVFLNDFIDIRIDIPEIAQALDPSSSKRAQPIEEAQLDGHISVPRLRVLQTVPAPLAPLGVFHPAQSTQQAPESTSRPTPTAPLQEHPYQAVAVLPAPILRAPEQAQSSKVFGLPDPSKPETPNTKVCHDLQPQRKQEHNTEEHSCCRVCASPAVTFVKHTLCCGVPLCFRCWDRFYVPHVQTARCCPYC